MATEITACFPLQEMSLWRKEVKYTALNGRIETDKQIDSLLGEIERVLLGLSDRSC